MKSLQVRTLLAGWVLGALTLATPARALEAGINVDIHQDIQDPLFWPNDFHIEGLICSHEITPILMQQINGLFPPINFIYTITPISGEECWYWFEATWWLDPGQYIPYCHVMHLGLLFDVRNSNIIIDLIGWWTRDGVPVGQIYGGLYNRGYVPMLGFNVMDTEMPQVLQVTNGQPDLPLPVPPLPPPLPPMPPWPPAPIELLLSHFDVIPFPPGTPPPFEELNYAGQQQFWPWIPVLNQNGAPISPSNPLWFNVDSFFDVFLSAPPGGPSGLGVAEPFTIEPGGFLVTRQAAVFINNNGEVEERWFWEIHGAQPPEACCFDDGHCEDLLPFTCTDLGGHPMGQGTACAFIDCPILGACCIPTPVGYNCTVTDQITCEQQFLGQWKGPGTNCDDLNANGTADICEPPPQGACCYGEVAILCIVTDEATCAQLVNGQWKGEGTTCDDLNGNGVADICDTTIQPEACCMPDGLCLMMPPHDCVLSLGRPLGPGSLCLGDWDGDGADEACEAKWYQPPDLAPTGIDVMATEPFVLADDFLCTEHGLITEIVVFGSWRYDQVPPGGPTDAHFFLSLHADIPAWQSPTGYSMPGEPLWLRPFPPLTYLAEPFAFNLQEGWMEPPDLYQFPGDTVCWMYRFQVPAAEAFCQEGTPDAPIVYWLDVKAMPNGGPALSQFGWKTSSQHWNDDAVWGRGPEPYLGPWSELRYPPQHPWHPQSIDLAFAVNGDLPCPPTGACCVAGVCYQVTAARCQQMLGYYKGDGTVCTAVTCICRGDANCNGQVDFADINPFVDALLSGAYCDGTGANADVNGNGTVGFDDINPFVNLLTQNPLPIICP